MLKETTKHGVAEYQVVDHGVHHEKYFPGYNPTCADLKFAFTGMGHTVKEAINKATKEASELFTIPAQLEKECEEANDDIFDILYFDEWKQSTYFKKDHYHFVTVVFTKR